MEDRGDQLVGRADNSISNPDKDFGGKKKMFQNEPQDRTGVSLRVCSLPHCDIEYFGIILWTYDLSYRIVRGWAKTDVCRGSYKRPGELLEKAVLQQNTVEPRHSSAAQFLQFLPPCWIKLIKFHLSFVLLSRWLSPHITFLLVSSPLASVRSDPCKCVKFFAVSNAIWKQETLMIVT